jgi:ATP-dependent Clp protease ATP-binding subunit ClpA
MLNEKLVQSLNVNITGIIDRSYTCTNEGNRCFEFVLNEKIFMIYLINNEYFLTELKLEDSFFNEFDILDNVTIEEIKAYLNNEIVGQEEAINEIIASLKSKESDLPVSILLTGSTGVGKTKTVKEIATYLKMPLVRLDLSEYNEPVSINRLIGSSAGYVGYDDENIFDRIRMYPNSIVLLDELEKANSNVINLFLQVLDEGFITNAKGEKIDFKNTYIFMTSNAEINNKIGFMKGKSNYQNSFSKEFLGRITCIVNYKNVTEDMVKKYLSKKGIKNSLILKEFDYENQGFRGLDKYIKKKKMKVR